MLSVRLVTHPSTSAKPEKGTTYHLTLTTLAGNDILVPANLWEHDMFEALEDLIVEYLPTVSQIDTFGCEVELLHPDTQESLKDPIQDTLRNNTHFHLVVRQCFEVFEHK